MPKGFPNSGTKAPRRDFASPSDKLRVELAKFVCKQRSEAAAARAIGVHFMTVRAAISGERTIAVATIARIEAFLGLPPSPATRVFYAASTEEVL